MKTHGICSVCNDELSLWKSLISASPFTIRCPQCKSKLKAGSRGLELIYTVVVVYCSIVALFGLFGLLISSHISTLMFFVALVFLTLALIGLDIGTRIILFTYSAFVPIEKRKSYGCLTVIVGVVVLHFLFLSVMITFTSETETKLVVVPSQVPVIEALSKYKSVNGNYPDNIELLIPEYLKSLPDCYDSTFIVDGAVARYYLNPKDGHYILSCNNIAFSNTVYSSRDNTWTVLD